MAIKCPACDGTGKVICPYCKEDKVKEVNVTAEHGVGERHEYVCGKCKGKFDRIA